MEDSHKIDPGRRSVLKKIGLGAGAATALPMILPASAVRAATTPSSPRTDQAAAATAEVEWTPIFFDAHQNDTVIALTELIIPATDTPGAKDAQVNRFWDLLLNEQETDVKAAAIQGLAWIDARSIERHGKPFVDLAPDQQTALIEPLADPANQRPEDQVGVRFFDHLKSMTIYAYYTSKPGLEQELQYGGDEYNAEYPGACTHPEHQI